LSTWRGVPVSAKDVHELTVGEATMIYKANYWDPCSCDNLPAALALVVLDAAVNSGVRRSVMFLQFALEIPPDGICLTRTIAAANKCNVAEVVRASIAARLAFLKQLLTWGAFGAGWEKRCTQLEERALAMDCGG